jgi:TRAP-type C4-dicarboxylate transport system substrate-binding protein
MANAYGDLQTAPVVEQFVSQVEARSGGSLRVKAVSRWGDYADDAEQQVVRAVAAGEVDLGWAGARVFDTMGVPSFQALQAPMLIDSYALEQAVAASDTPGQMLQGLDKVGVRGLGVLPDGLRKPIAVKHPLLGLGDWRGITFGTLKSDGQAQAIRSLGATPMEVFRRARNQALLDGSLQGLEMDLFVYEHAGLVRPAPYMTANVTLWPQMDVLFANPSRLGALAEQQRGWLQQAARDAAGRVATLADRDAQSLERACRSGARFATASPADLAVMRNAFAPVYASLERDPQTRAFIDQIQALKRSTAAEAPLAIPAGCTGKVSEQPAASTGTVPADLNGVYRWTITREEARKGGEPDWKNEYPMVATAILKDGHMDQGPGGPGTTYSVDGKGNLHLTPVPPMEKGDQFVWSRKAWTKIG